MADTVTLIKTPIKEIIFTLSFIENVDEVHLERFRSIPFIEERFPLADKGFNAQLKSVNSQLPKANVTWDGYVLRNGTPHNKLLQVRKGSISFHIVNMYERFDVIINELTEYWNLLVECCGNLTVSFLSVRYVNFIELMDGDKIEDLIKIKTSNPFDSTVVNTITQQRFNYHNNPSINVNVVSAQGKNDSKDGIILDIILSKKLVDPNPKFNFEELSDMRVVKNDLFFKSITNKTIERFSK